MSNDDIPEMDFVSMDADFQSIMEASVDNITKEFKPGQKVEGVVTMIGENNIFVDINSKSEGIIPKVEFIKDDELKVQEGDTVVAYFVSEAGGEISLTVRMSGDALHDTLNEAFSNQVPVEGKVLEERKGGFTVSLSGIQAFCPYSQIDRRSDDPSLYVGKTFTFIIIRLTEFDVVVSRRPLLEQEMEERIDELKDKLNEGDILKGVVRKIETFGVFVDLGGIDGLIPMHEVSWERNFDVNDILKAGDNVEITVRNVDWDRNRILLSLRESQGNPWEKIDFKENTPYKGTVTRIESYGAFVELKPGLEGLLHISKLGKGKRLDHATEAVSPGDELEVYVLDVNQDTRRISLSLEDEEHKFEGHEQSGVPQGESNAVHVGNTVTGTVDGIKRYGLFVKLNDTKSGLLHISMFDVPPGGDSLRFLSSNYSQGDEIKVEVLHIEGPRVSLGLPGSTAEMENQDSIKSYIKNKEEKSLGSLNDLFGGLNL